MKIFITIPKDGKRPFARVTITNDFTGESKQFIGSLNWSAKEAATFYFNDCLRLEQNSTPEGSHHG